MKLSPLSPIESVMKKATFAVLLLWAVIAVGQQQSTLPQRDGTTVADLKEQIADCTISASAQAKYEAKLVARIGDLEKEVAALRKAAQSAPGK